MGAVLRCTAAEAYIDNITSSQEEYRQSQGHSQSRHGLVERESQEAELTRRSAHFENRILRRDRNPFFEGESCSQQLRQGVIERSKTTAPLSLSMLRIDPDLWGDYVLSLPNSISRLASKGTRYDRSEICIGF
jgi:hypothetical protein